VSFWYVCFNFISYVFTDFVFVSIGVYFAFMSFGMFVFVLFSMFVFYF
jgi:hypothetical protein